MSQSSWNLFLGHTVLINELIPIFQVVPGYSWFPSYYFSGINRMNPSEGSEYNRIPGNSRFSSICADLKLVYTTRAQSGHAYNWKAGENGPPEGRTTRSGRSGEMFHSSDSAISPKAGQGMASRPLSFHYCVNRESANSTRARGGNSPRFFFNIPAAKTSRELQGDFIPINPISHMKYLITSQEQSLCLKQCCQHVKL